MTSEDPTSVQTSDRIKEAKQLLHNFEELEVRDGPPDFHMSKLNAVLSYPDVERLNKEVQYLINRLQSIQ